MNSTESSLFTEPLAFKIAKTILYVVILILSTVGNTMVIIIICRFKHMKRQAGNLFIVNLALCDLLTPLISIPLEMVLEQHDYTWIFGAAACKLFPPAVTFFTTSSSLTLAAISLDRYRTLMHPFKPRLDAKTVKIIIAIVHCCSGVLITPHIVTSKLSSADQCAEVWPNEWLPKIYTFVLVIGQYAGPLVFMVAMYLFAARDLFVTTKRARSFSNSSAKSTIKRHGLLKPITARLKANSHDSLDRHFRKQNEHNAQITKIFIIIVVIFAVFTLPVEVLWIWADYAGGINHRLYPTIAVICRMFTYANSCLNPIIFYKFSRDFHNGFLTFFKYPLSCRDNRTLARTNGVRNRKTTSSNLTPHGSLQSTPRLTPQGSCHSVSIADPEKPFYESKSDHNLNIPSTDFNSYNKHSMADRTLEQNLQEPHQTRDISKYLNSNTDLSEEHVSNRDCNVSIKVFYYECDLTIELDKLESLLVLPQTDC